MKEKRLLLVILPILYVIVCTASYVYGKDNDVNVFNRIDSNPTKTAELSMISRVLEENHPVLNDVRTESKVISLMYNNIDHYNVHELYFTDNENYRDYLQKNKIEDIDKVKIVEDYETSIPLFTDDKFKKVKDALVNEEPKDARDLLVVVAQGGKVVDNFYIDGRFADFSSMINTNTNDPAYYQKGYNKLEIFLSKIENSAHKYKAIPPSDNIYDELRARVEYEEGYVTNADGSPIENDENSF